MNIHFSNPFTSGPIRQNTNVTQQSLRKWNIVLATLHALQGIVVLLLSTDRTFPIVASFLTKDSLASDATGQFVLAPATHVLFNLNLAQVVAVFFFLSAIAHALMATKYRRRYENDLKNGINRLRWFEYSLSASVMMVAIAVLSGVYDAGSLVMVFALTAIMSLLGLVMEAHNSKLTNKQAPNWLSFIVGSVAGVVPWLVVAGYLVATNVFGSGNIPTFVYWIYGTMFVLFSSFAVNMYLQYTKRGRWGDYYFGERGYMVLSLVAKSLLAWQIFFGALRP